MVNEMVTAKEVTTLNQGLGDISDFGVNGAQPISGLGLLFLGQSAVGQPAKMGQQTPASQNRCLGPHLENLPCAYTMNTKIDININNTTDPDFSLSVALDYSFLGYTTC